MTGGSSIGGSLIGGLGSSSSGGGLGGSSSVILTVNTALLDLRPADDLSLQNWVGPVNVFKQQPLYVSKSRIERVSW